MVVKVDPHRNQEEADALLRFPLERDKILLYGSSFFQHWGVERASRQMDGLVVNHGFGGATGEELIYRYHDLVLPNRPKAIILRGGLNDVLNGYTAKQAAHFIERVIGWARYDFEGVRFGLIPGFYCPWYFNLEEKLQKAIDEYNQRMIDFAKENEDTVYLDINPFFYEEGVKVGSSKGFRDFFVEDGLHLKDEGYEAFAPYFKQMLSENGFLNL